MQKVAEFGPNFFEVILLEPEMTDACIAIRQFLQGNHTKVRVYALSTNNKVCLRELPFHGVIKKLTERFAKKL